MVREARGRGPVVFIGNGLSDRCAVGEADWIFAKEYFAAYCAERGAAYTEFHTFTDLSRGWLASRT